MCKLWASHFSMPPRVKEKWVPKETLVVEAVTDFDGDIIDSGRDM